MTAIGVRRAAPADLDALVALHREFCTQDHHRFDERRARAAFVPLLSGDDHGVVWLLDGDAGYAVVTWGWSIEAGGPEAVLDEIFVVEQRRGLGSAMLDHLIADARQRGVARIFLETEAHNATVRGLYLRHGFAVDDSIWMSLDLTDLS